MSKSVWAHICEAWSDEMIDILVRIETTEIFEDEEVLAKEKRSLCFPPATESQIAKLESRLGLNLPPTYRAFLMYTNGFLQLAMGGGPGRFLIADEVNFYKHLYPDKYKIFSQIESKTPDKEYFVYGSKQDPARYRTSYAKDLIAVSSHDSSTVYLLNPTVTFDNGEYESWYFDFHGGAVRYKSFFDLMTAEKIRSVRGYKELLPD